MAQQQNAKSGILDADENTLENFISNIKIPVAATVNQNHSNAVGALSVSNDGSVPLKHREKISGTLVENACHHVDVLHGMTSCVTCDTKNTVSVPNGDTNTAPHHVGYGTFNELMKDVHSSFIDVDGMQIEGRHLSNKSHVEPGLIKVKETAAPSDVRPSGLKCEEGTSVLVCGAVSKVKQEDLCGNTAAPSVVLGDEIVPLHLVKGYGSPIHHSSKKSQEIKGDASSGESESHTLENAKQQLAATNCKAQIFIVIFLILSVVGRKESKSKQEQYKNQ